MALNGLTHWSVESNIPDSSRYLADVLGHDKGSHTHRNNGVAASAAAPKRPKQSTLAIAGVNVDEALSASLANGGTEKS
jgi:hypothetical protein